MQENNRAKWKRKLIGNGMKQGILQKVLIYSLLILLGFIFIYPLAYMIALSFQTVSDLFDSSVKWIPTNYEIRNYIVAAKTLNLPTTFKSFFGLNSLWSTVIIVLVPSFVSTLVCGLIGYGFSRFNFPGKKIWMVLVISTFIIPSQVIMLPQFVWFKKLKILGTIWSYFIPATLGQGVNSAIFILIFYAFFNMIPKSLDEAAMLDGANEFKIFWKVGVPLSFQPVIISILFHIVWYWNDYYRASIFLNGTKWVTLPLLLSRFENLYANTEEAMEFAKNINEPIIMAATILTILPLLLMYLFLQKFFVESIDRTGITGE